MNILINTGNCVDCTRPTYLSKYGYYAKRCRNCANKFYKSGKKEQVRVYNTGTCEKCKGHVMPYRTENGVHYYRSLCGACLMKDFKATSAERKKRIAENKQELSEWLKDCERRRWIGDLYDISKILHFYDLFGKTSDRLEQKSTGEQLQFMFNFLKKVNEKNNI